ncbi:DUF6207 family protein [Streptomyces sp. NPDC030392]|uniref:DUF6207 family protein n=1 Tax=Streptomyces sp. NPDC030392 TaxID=3155468 RepID=UPI0033DE5669
MSIAPQHLEDGIVVSDLAAAGEKTALTVMDTLDRLWATSGTATVRRVPGEPGVRARLYADVRRRPETGEPS